MPSHTRPDTVTGGGPLSGRNCIHPSNSYGNDVRALYSIIAARPAGARTFYSYHYYRLIMLKLET
jgi:hypothetical protein